MEAGGIAGIVVGVVVVGAAVTFVFLWLRYAKLVRSIEAANAAAALSAGRVVGGQPPPDPGRHRGGAPSVAAGAAAVPGGHIEREGSRGSVVRGGSFAAGGGSSGGSGGDSGGGAPVEGVRERAPSAAGGGADGGGRHRAPSAGNSGSRTRARTSSAAATAGSSVPLPAIGEDDGLEVLTVEVGGEMSLEIPTHGNLLHGHAVTAAAARASQRNLLGAAGGRATRTHAPTFATGTVGVVDLGRKSHAATSTLASPAAFARRAEAFMGATLPKHLLADIMQAVTESAEAVIASIDDDASGLLASSSSESGSGDDGEPPPRGDDAAAAAVGSGGGGGASPHPLPVRERSMVRRATSWRNLHPEVLDALVDAALASASSHLAGTGGGGGAGASTGSTTRPPRTTLTSGARQEMKAAAVAAGVAVAKGRVPARRRLRGSVLPPATPFQPPPLRPEISRFEGMNPLAAVMTPQHRRTVTAAGAEGRTYVAVQPPSFCTFVIDVLLSACGCYACRDRCASRRLPLYGAQAAPPPAVPTGGARRSKLAAAFAGGGGGGRARKAPPMRISVYDAAGEDSDDKAVGLPRDASSDELRSPAPPPDAASSRHGVRRITLAAARLPPTIVERSRSSLIEAPTVDAHAAIRRQTSRRLTLAPAAAVTERVAFDNTVEPLRIRRVTHAMMEGAADAAVDPSARPPSSGAAAPVLQGVTPPAATLDV